MLNIVLFGPPGSGKGTQAAIISEKLCLKHLSTGDLLRAQIKEQTPLGKQAKEYIDAGTLVPDEVVIGMIGQAIDAASGFDGFIFDGFPRTIPQAEALDGLLNTRQLKISCVLSLSVDDKEIITRILNRSKTSGRSDDADVATIQKRIDVYNEETSPVASYYDKQGKLTEIEGIGSIEQINEKLMDVISKQKAAV